MSVIVKTISPSNIKTRWREPFASEAINKKGVGTISPGVYRGLILEESSPPVDLTVKVASDSVVGDHVAIAETTNGFSVTFNDDAGDFNLDLSAASLLGQDVVITLEVSYAVGANTAGNYVAYTVADFDALTAEVKAGLIVLGTVAVPTAPPAQIPAADISINRRSFPSDRPVGAPLQKLTKNGGFEVASSGSDLPLVFRQWRTTNTPVHEEFLSHVAEFNSGAKCAELNRATASVITAFQLAQDINVPVVEGQNIRIRMFKKALVGAGAGTATFGISYRDVNGDPAGAQSIGFDVDSIDASFVEIGAGFIVPAGVHELAFVEVAGTGMNYGSTGAVLLFDDIDLFVEETGDNLDLPNEIRGAKSVVGALTFEQEDHSYDSIGAALRFENENDSSGDLVLDRKDGAVIVAGTGLNPVGLAVKGRVKRLGEELIVTIGGPDIPRISAPSSVFANVEYTLMWESIPLSEKGYRKYVGRDGALLQTVNAFWNNSSNQWAKDVNGEEASMSQQTSLGDVINRMQVTGINVWADNAWDRPTKIMMVTAAMFVREAVADWQYSNVTGAIFFNNGEERAVAGLPLHVGDTIVSAEFYATGGGTGNDMEFSITYGFPTSGSGVTIGSETNDTTGSFSQVVVAAVTQTVAVGRPYMLKVVSSVSATADRFSHAELLYKPV